jgi:hypothetical protein
MTPTELEHWMQRHDLSKHAAAAELDISRNRLKRHLSGASPIPRHIALACAAIDAGIEAAKAT